MDTLRCGCTRNDDSYRCISHRDVYDNTPFRSFEKPNSAIVKQRLAAIDLAVAETIRRVKENGLVLDGTAYAHVCEQRVAHTSRLLWSTGKLHAWGPFMYPPFYAGNHKWLDAARAVCGVRTGSAKYLVKRYPQEVAQVLKHVYPGISGAYYLESQK